MLNPFEEDDVMNEIENLRKLSHEQIIEYYDCLKEDQGNKIILYVIMNFSKGSLRDLIKNKKKFSA